MSGKELSNLQDELAELWATQGPAAVHARILDTRTDLVHALLMANIGARAREVSSIF